jgi:multimeric flavodoxin WrbA
MNAIAVNGSPRKRWNTATLLENALAGAASCGMTTEVVHLYDHAYQGCTSCFKCKRIGGKSYGKCAMKDELTPVLDRISACDVLILGAPIYFHAETGEMRSFIERLIFPYLEYKPDYPTIAPKKIATALVYTMNIKEQDLSRYSNLEDTRQTLARFFGICDILYCTDTYQFSDYSKYVSSGFDAEAKAKRRAEVFPQDCAKAFALGARLATQAGES